MRDAATRSLREHNRARVLALLEANVALSRSELVLGTGLSRTTVAAIVDELLAAGAVRATSSAVAASGPSGPGRRPELLTLVREAGFGLALDIGHESLRVALTGPAGNVVTHRAVRLAADQSADSVVARAAEMTHEILAGMGRRLRDATGIVAAIPEPIDGSGTVPRSDRVSRWRGRNPALLLSAAIGAPAIAENDTNLAVIGERLYGRARGIDDIVYVKVAHGVGMGIVMNGMLVRGGSGLAGEVGHIRVREDGMICTCGNRGCLYTLVTGEYLARLLGPTIEDPHRGTAELVSMAARNDVGATRLLHDAGAEVGKVLATVCNILNPTAVVLGGRLAHAGSALLDGFRESMERYAEPQVSAELRLGLTSLNESAELLGAAAVAAGIAELPGVSAPRAPDSPAVERRPRASSSR